MMFCSGISVAILSGRVCRRLKLLNKEVMYKYIYCPSLKKEI